MVWIVNEHTFSDLMNLVDYESLRFIADNIDLSELDGGIKETKLFEGRNARFYRKYIDALFVYYNQSVIEIKGGWSTNNCWWDNKEKTKGKIMINLSQSELEQRASILHELIELELRKKAELTNIEFPKDLGHQVSCEYEKRYKKDAWWKKKE